MFKFLKILFATEEKPKWRLVPDKEGTYTLERYHASCNMYLAEAFSITPEESDGIIANLERDTLYYREETKDD